MCLAAIQVWTANQPRHPQVGAQYTCSTASFVVAGSGAMPAGSRLAVRQPSLAQPEKKIKKKD